jgi:FAD/FMN-containing dehydrogenase
VEAALAEALAAGLIADATLAASGAQARELWFIREAIVDAQGHEGGSIKHDVSVPLSRVAAFIDKATATVTTTVPGARPVPFGHVGDGNIHFNVSQPIGADPRSFLARWDEIGRAVHDIVLAMGGSISAEHGIGRFKRNEMLRIKSPVELALMRTLKAALDPQGIMNPGKLLP